MLGGCASLIPDNSSKPVEMYLEDSWYYIDYSSITSDVADAICYSKYRKPCSTIRSLTLTERDAINRHLYTGVFNCSGSMNNICGCERHVNTSSTELIFPAKVASIECNLGKQCHSSFIKGQYTF